jgi:septum formation protein
MSAAGLWRGPEPLLLASTSATRRTLLENAGLPVETEAAGIDERAIEAQVGSSDPGELAMRLAGEKALAVSRRRPGRFVVGADQTLALEGTLLHRPADAVAAKAQIAQLSGRMHTLHSALAVARDGEVLDRAVDLARLTVRRLSPAQIALYARLAGEARLTLSVGAYQIEGLGVHLFDRLEGDHTTILGLPMLPLLRVLRALGLLAL